MGGWSVMIMILCVYKWCENYVFVCVQVTYNVYKWRMCTSDLICVCTSDVPAHYAGPNLQGFA